MGHVIIGTAGHIDHGKTALIKALTGRDTDRLAEEKRRGITIELGFTYFDLKDGSRVGIVDVPGHEKFIDHMAAGAAGMDMVLLVIAADEGIMPQTREHMDILNLLGVKKCILVLNKCDLADREWLDMTEADIREELSGTYLEGAPLLRVSAKTGEGIDRLAEMIASMACEKAEKRQTQGAPRLPVDRVFSLSGVGTVVTGTLMDGRIEREDMLQIYPGGKLCRVRNIQTHGENVPSCEAGQRTALNVAGCEKEDLKRGCVLSLPGALNAGRILDVKLTLLASSARRIKNQTRLHFFSGTSKALCRAVPLDTQELRPGESCYAQLRMEEDVALKAGDRFIVRFYSPLETIGGGVVLDANAGRRKRFCEKDIEELKLREQDEEEGFAGSQIQKLVSSPVTAEELEEKVKLSLQTVKGMLRRLALQGRMTEISVQERTYFWDRERQEACRGQIQGFLECFMQEHPYCPGVSKAQIRNRFLKEIKKQAADCYLTWLEQEAVLEQRGEFLLPYGYQLPQNGEFARIREKLYAAFTEAKYDFVRMGDISFGGVPEKTVEEILFLLVSNGEIVRLTEEMYTLKVYMDAAEERIAEVLKAEGKITVSQVRDMFQTTRRSAKPILEYMDRRKVTKKNGPESERVSNL